MGMKTSDKIATFFKYFVLILVGGIMIYPLLWMDHDQAHQDQDKILKKRRNGVGCFHSHTVTPYLSSE